MQGWWGVQGSRFLNFNWIISTGLGGKVAECTNSQKLVTAQFAIIKEDIVLLLSIRVSGWQYDPAHKFCAGFVTKDVALRVKF